MSLDYLSRVATLPFRLGCPEDLPDTLDGVRRAGAGRPAALLRWLADPSCRSDLPALLAAARAARAERREPIGEPGGADPLESEANQHNDLAFGIVRTRGPVVELLVDAAVAALIGVLEVTVDRSCGLAQAEWKRLVIGVDSLLAWTADPHRAPRPLPVPRLGDPGPTQPEDALRRWVRGHHVFMVLAQATALATRCVTHSAKTTDLRGAEAAASAAVDLMWASQAALRYAGDANKQQYNAEIRPTLMPPVAPPKMSGLHWRDHEALVRALLSSKDAWEWLSLRRPDLLEMFRSGLDGTYVSHQGVCRHFVGEQSPSLLATTRSARSAVGVLAQFRQIRLQMLPEAPGQSRPHQSE